MALVFHHIVYGQVVSIRLPLHCPCMRMDMQCRCFLRIIRFYDIGILLYFIWTRSFLLSDSLFYSTIFSTIISFQQSISFHQLTLLKTSFFSTRSSFLTIIFFFLSFLYSKAVPLKAALLQQRERFLHATKASIQQCVFPQA